MSSLSNRIQWSSKWVFVLAAIGVAVGLGNVWKLPHVISENGGAAFVYAYLLSMLLVMLPILMVEIIIGKQAQANPLSAVFNLVNQLKASKFWRLIGCLALIVGVIVLAYLSVAGGWSIFYIIKSISNGFADTPGEMIQGEFGVLLSNPMQLIIWLSVFMLCAIGIVSRGIKQGVEIAVRFLVPAVLLLLLAMFIYCYNTMELAETLELMFSFELVKLSTEVVVNALVYALLTTGLALGVIMMYSSYLPKETAVSGISIVVIFANVLVALAISFIICTLAFNYDAFSHDRELLTAPAMIYQVLPVVFAEMPKGVVFASVFFITVFIATLIAAVALLEPVIGWLTERFKFERKLTSWYVGGGVWLLGIIVALSQNTWAFEFDFLAIERTKGVADILAIVSTNIIVPLGAFMMAIFAAKKSTKAFFREELALPAKPLFKIWRFIVRFVCFISLAIVFLYLMFGALFTYNECMVTFQLPDMSVRFELCNH